MSQRLRHVIDRVSAGLASSPPPDDSQGDKLTDRYDDALRSKIGRAVGLGAVEREIVEEMAASLGRAEAKLLAAIDEARARLTIWQARCSEGDAQLVAEAKKGFEESRARALHLRWELTVQREAIGMRQGLSVDERYPIPEPLDRSRST